MVSNQTPNEATRSHSEALVDFDGAAAFLATSPRHVRRLWAERRLTGIRVGSKVRFRVEDLIDYIDRQRVEAVR
jgi:excisionase family DNA binding protein